MGKTAEAWRGGMACSQSHRCLAGGPGLMWNFYEGSYSRLCLRFYGEGEFFFFTFKKKNLSVFIYSLCFSWLYRSTDLELKLYFNQCLETGNYLKRNTNVCWFSKLLFLVNKAPEAKGSPVIQPIKL